MILHTHTHTHTHMYTHVHTYLYTYKMCPILIFPTKKTDFTKK